MIKLNIDGFTGQYQNLNGQQTLPVSRLDLILAMVTVGNRGPISTLNRFGYWTVLERICQSFNYLRFDRQSNLILHNSHFDNLNKSEKDPITYRIGQALTKLFAESYLQVSHVLHVQSFASKNINPNYQPKRIISKSIIDGKEPDLVGCDLNNNWHVFEAKGRSTAITKSLRQKAINQVSKITSINGSSPLTKVACCFNTKAVPIEGWIDDPTGAPSTDLFFDPRDFFLNYYSDLVIPRPLHPYSIKNFDLDLFILDEYENYVFGIESKTFRVMTKRVFEPKNLLMQSKYFAEKKNKINKESKIALGLDGLVIFEKGKKAY